LRKPPKLKDEQKEKLSRLEPALRDAAKKGDYSSAKKIAHDIQNILRPTGHETRLMQSKNWLFEAALEAGEIDTAISGFIGVRKKVFNNTRVFLEATALLAVCLLRKGEIEKAEPLMSYVLRNESVIKSERRRRQFRLNVIQRFEEEATIASFRGKYSEKIDAEELQNEAGKLVQFQNEDEMFTTLGKASPPETKILILRIEEFARKQLPKAEIKYLADPRERVKDEQVGRTVFSSVKRVMYRSLCDPNSDIYKMWFTNGLSAALNKFCLGSIIISVLAGLGIGIKAVAIPVAALIIKFGIEVYCERFKPEGIMIER
jgi:hypothetical protein